MALSNGFLECEGILRCHVSVGGKRVEAFLSLATCEAVHRQAPRAENLADFYLKYLPVLHEIVLRKVSAVTRHPVVVVVVVLVVARDLRGQPPGHRPRLELGVPGQHAHDAGQADSAGQ